MVLDILDSLELNESDLSVYELSFVRQAQDKKNALTQKLIAEKKQLQEKLLKNGILRGTVLEKGTQELEARYLENVAQIADDLAFRLAYLAVDGSGGNVNHSYPNDPDYDLAPADRYYVVYKYYMAMTDPSVRFAIFQADTLAREYLGSFYATLYDRLRSYIQVN